MALNKFRPPDMPYTATPTPMYLRSRQASPFTVRPQRIAASPGMSGIAPPVSPPMDMSQLPPEVLAQLQALGPSPQPPTMQGPQGFNIGSFQVPGSALDAAAYGAQNAIQNMPPARNFGQGLVGGLVGGLAQSRVNQAAGRSQANQTAAAEYQKQLDAYKTAASEAGKQLAAHRYRMAEIQAEQAGKPVTDPMVDVTTPAMQGFFRKVSFTPPPGVTQMKQSELAALGKPTAADRQQPVEPETLHFLAEQSAATGQPPSYGLLRGMSSQDKSQYLNYWRQLSGNGYNAAKAASAYAGLKGTTVVLQKQLGAAQAWGGLVDANIGLVTPILQQIKDSGMPWANGPARAYVKQMGDVPQAQFESAMLPLRNEIAKLVSTPGMTGVLTVEAQRDMRSVLNNNYTVPQLEGVFAILEKEKQNRLNAYQSAIGQTQAGIGIDQPGIAPPPVAPQPPAPKVAPKPAQKGGWFDTNRPK